MPPGEAVSETQLAELEAAARRASNEPAFRLEQGPGGRTYIRLDEGVQKALEAVPRLVGEVRRLGRQVGKLQAEREKLAEERASRGKDAKDERTERPDAATSETADELASLLSAPFRISPKAQGRAKDDPLAALAVQVAKALSDGASELERARLIAMAFAASEGDLEGFWEARRRRGGSKAKKATVE